MQIYIGIMPLNDFDLASKSQNLLTVTKERNGPGPGSKFNYAKEQGNSIFRNPGSRRFEVFCFWPRHCIGLMLCQRELLFICLRHDRERGRLFSHINID